MEWAWLTWREGDHDPERSAWRPEVLRKRGLAEPKTLIDVGVGRGTPTLYEAFPDAHLVLIEPLAEHESDLQRWAMKYHGEYHLTAVGDSDGTTTIQIGRQDYEHSTIRGWSRAESAGEREIPITTLDRLARERGWEQPFALKIDTEGYEDRVVMGAARVLRATPFVIADVNTIPRFKDSYSFADFIALMDSHGFSLYDLIDGQRGPSDSYLWYVDAFFVHTRKVPRHPRNE